MCNTCFRKAITNVDFRRRGNWGVDLQAGSVYGYKLLFIVLLAGIFAVFLQVCNHTSLETQFLLIWPQDSCQSIRMCHRSGYVPFYLDNRPISASNTSPLDLASHCRILLHSRPKHKLLYRYLLLYPLYILSEVAIISTDLAELLGSAIALSLIWPKLPLWAGVLLTAGDVLFLLALGDPLGGRPAKMFEYFIAVLVGSFTACCFGLWTDIST